jgi:hypothetical protein
VDSIWCPWISRGEGTMGCLHILPGENAVVSRVQEISATWETSLTKSLWRRCLNCTGKWSCNVNHSHPCDTVWLFVRSSSDFMALIPLGNEELGRLWKQQSQCNLRHYTNICLEWGKTLKTSQDSWHAVQDLNPRHPKHKI